MGTLASAMKSPGPNMSAETPGIEAISSTFAIPLTLSIWGMRAMWLLEVFMLKASSAYREASEMPGVKVHGLNERAPMGAAFVCKLNWLPRFSLSFQIVALLILTVEHLLLKLLDLFLGLAVGDDDASCTGVQRRRQCNLILLGHSDND